MMESKNKMAVYTVLVGGYDEILQPLVIDDRFDYVLFTDEKHSEKNGVWQVRTFDYKNADKTRESRYPKMHPEELLAEYEASLYIDANVQITDREIYDYVQLAVEQGYDWGGVSCSSRDCIYEESLVVLINQLEIPRNVFMWCHRLRKEDYPRHNGVLINNTIFRQHNERVRMADELWWELYEQYSRRDQLLLPYVFWKTQSIKRGWLLPFGENAWSIDSLEVRAHSDNNSCRNIKNGGIQRWLLSCLGNINYRKYFNFYYRLCSLPPRVACFLFALYGPFYLLFHSPIAMLHWCKTRNLIS